MDDVLQNFNITLNESNYTYKEIFNKRFDINIGSYIFVKDYLDRYFSLEYEQQKYDFYTKPLTITINNLSFKDIYSYEQIKGILKEHNFNNVYLKGPNNQYKNLTPLLIIESIENNKYELIFTSNNILYNSFEEDKKPFLIKSPNAFAPLDATKYFYDYFKYNNKEEEKNSSFIYDNTNERRLLFTYLNILHSSKYLYLFKFTGPSSNGKSTSLLYYSRTAINIFYFNLSYLSRKEKEKDFVSCYNTILEEFNRVHLGKEQLIKYSSLLKIQEGNRPWIVISNIFDFLSEMPYIYTFIFDQFKKDNIDQDIFTKLLSNVKKKRKIKFIICSSINDREIKEEYLKTIIDYKGNPIELNQMTQDYYFYFTFLFRPKQIKKDKYYLLFKLFDFKPKYKRLLLNAKKNDFQSEINKIDDRIEKKLSEFESSSSIIRAKQINLFESLINVLQILDMDIEYENLGLYYDIVPLKYFYFEFNEKFFRIHYAFEYIKIFIKKKIEVMNNDKYFLESNIHNDLLAQNIKGYYFEKSVINSIKKRNIIFERNYQEIVKINEIVAMDFIIRDKLEEALQRIRLNDFSEINDEEEDYYLNNLNENNLSKKNDEKKNNDNNKKIQSKDKFYINKINNEIIVTNKYFMNESNIRNNEKLQKVKNEKTKNPSLKDEIIEEENDNSSSFISDEDDKRDDDKKDNKEKKKLCIIYKNRLKKMEEIKKEILNKIQKSNKYIDYSIPKDNILSINDLKNNINSFSRIDNNTRILNNDYKNKSILIEQEKINGICIDMAMIWNENKKNIFIGFQMKCFKEKTLGGKISKMSIKNFYLDILHNSYNLLGIDISEWYYIMVLYYNPKKINDKKKEYGFCTYLVNKCKKHGIKYIFYDPGEKIFYDKYLSPIKEKYTLLDNESNLDYGEEFSMIQEYFIQPFPCEFLRKKHLRVEEIIAKKIEDFDSFKSFLNKRFNKLNRKYNFNNFKDDLKGLYSRIQKIKFLQKIDASGIGSFIPKPNHLFCFEGANNEPLIILKISRNEVEKYSGLISKKDYNGFLDFSEDIKNKSYFYALKFSINIK